MPDECLQCESSAGTELSDLSIRELLARLASPGLPGGGGGAALAAATAAALVEMAARLAGEDVREADAVAARAGELRARALELMEREGAAYLAVLSAQRDLRGGDRRARDALCRSLIDASEGPLALGEVATETAVLAARLARDGNPALFGDASAAVLAATAAVRTAERLVTANLGGLEGQTGRLGRARDLAERATATERFVLSLRVPTVPIPPERDIP